MSIIQLVYFALLFIIVLYKKKGMSVCGYISLLYLLVSISAVVGDGLDVFPSFKTNPSLFSTLVYCLLLTAIILPTYSFDEQTVNNLRISNSRALDYITYLFFTCFVFSLLTNWLQIGFILASDDWDQLRNIAIQEGGLFESQQYGPIGHVLTIVNNVLGSVSFVMFPIFFISLSKLSKPWWYVLMAFMGTLNVIVKGILTIDRSSVFKWFLFLGLSLVIFWPTLTTKAKRIITPVLLSTIIALSAYFAIVSISRFEKSDEGVQGNLVRYAGQSYYNFCYLFEHFDNHEGISTKYLFPATHFFILKDYKGNLDRQLELSNKSGIDCNLFYTVLGSFVLDANQIGPFLFIILYLVLFRLIGRPSKGHYPFRKFLLNYYMLLIPTFGIIAYVYVVPTMTISMIFLFYYCFLFKV